MATAADAVRIALGEVGYVEGPNNANKYARENGQVDGQAWCGSFTDWVLRRAGLTGEPSSIWTPSGLIAYRRLGRAIDRNGAIAPGDIVFFDWGGTTDASKVDHVGIVVAVRPDGLVETVEGNTSPSNQGSQSNGGGVYRRVRPRHVIAGFGRPAYDAQPSPTPGDASAFRRLVAGVLARNLAAAPTMRQGDRSNHVATLQKALNVFGKGLVTDGVYGPQTARAVADTQRFFGLAVDSVAGPRTIGVLVMALRRVAEGK